MRSNSKNIEYLNPNDIKISSLCKRNDEDIVAESVFARGIRITDIHEPFLVMKVGDTYELVDGARRLKTAIQIKKDKVPCIIDEGYDPSYGSKARYRNYLRFVVNYHRQDLPKSQKIYFINMAIRKYKLKLEDVAQMLGISEATLRRHLELSEVSQEIKELVDNNIITINSATVLKRLNTHGIKRFLSQVDTTTRIPDKNVSFIMKSLDPEVHFKDPDAIKRIRFSRQRNLTKPLVSRLSNQMPETNKKVLLDDINLQEEKKRQLDDQVKSFRHDFILVQPIIKAIMEKQEICNVIDKNVIKGFKEFLTYQSA